MIRIMVLTMVAASPVAAHTAAVVHTHGPAQSHALSPVLGVTLVGLALGVMLYRRARP